MEQQAATIIKPSGDQVRAGSTGDWLSPARFSLVLALVILAAFPQVILGLQTFVVRDFGFFAYPLAHFQRECFWRGELPLWNPYNNCGVPFLAQWNTMPLYPPALIYLLLPLGWSLSFFCLLHLFWAGLGMYFLAHRWTGNRLAASVAGLVFAFNGFSLNLLMWPSHIATFSWMPWVVLMGERGWREGGRKLIVAAFCGALQMLAGGPETILLTWLFLTAVWAMDLAQREAGLQRAMFWRFPVIVLLIAALAAAQLLPFLDLAVHSQREHGFADTRWSMPAWGWANFLVPMIFGQVWSMGVFFQHNQAWTSSYYLGVGTILLALFAIWTVRDKRVWLLGATALLGLLLSLGDQTIFYRGLRRLIPQLSLMTYPVKFVILITFAGPLLAAFAVTRLQNSNNNEVRVVKRRLLLMSGVMLGLIAAILLWAWRSPFPTDDYPGALRNGLGRGAFLVVVMFIALLLGKADARSKGTQILLPVFLLFLLWLDVWTHEPNQNPSVPVSIYEPNLARAKLAMQPQPELGQSRAMLTPAAALKFRQFVLSSPKDNFLVKRLGYFADCNLLDSVPKVDGFSSIYPRASDDLFSAIYGSTNMSFIRLENFMSVSQITAPGEFFRWEPRTNFLPLVTAGQRPVYFDETNMLRAVFASDFDGRRIVCLPKEARPLVSVTNETNARVISSRFQNQRVDVECEASEPSLLVLSQSFYHCWRALVDERPSPLLCANYAFQALQVPGGRHHLRLIYQDHAFFGGAIISGVTLSACLIACVGRKIIKCLT